MKIAVFDSGMGSLSIIKSIQKVTKAEIIYFADQKNYPYGKKSKSELKKIIQTTITKIKQKFEPDMIIIASNTPSILFSEFLNGDIIGVLPPVKLASKISKTKNIVIFFILGFVFIQKTVIFKMAFSHCLHSMRVPS